MPPHADLISIVFASGSEDLNQKLIDRVAAMYPELPLYVVAEFEPHRGQWIPYHVARSFRQNLSSVRAAIRGRGIKSAATFLFPRAPLRPMQLMAAMLSSRRILFFNENFEPLAPDVRGARRTIRLVTSRMVQAIRSQLKPGGRARKWLRRIKHPREAEIPFRARQAQAYGVAASLLRASSRPIPVRPPEPLIDGITVVIPSRNGRELLAEMLPRVLAQLPQGEIIVSDNGSQDGTAAWLAREYPSVRVIVTEAPLSFARAVNRGITEARFSHTLLLNNDMLIGPEFVSALRRAFQSIPDLFCSTAQIFFPSGARREETGKAVWRSEDALAFPVRCDEPLAGEDHSWVLYGSGGCSLFDTAKLRLLRGVSEVYEPAYVEDLDLGYRAWKKGWPSVFCARATVEHRHRSTTSRFYTPEQLRFFMERNHLRFLIHAVASPALFRENWLRSIRRLQIGGFEGDAVALETLRHVPHIGPRPEPASGPLTETEIFALGNGEVAVFPGRQARGFQSVIIVSPYVPFPLSHGGAVRIFNLMQHAAAERDQVLLVFTEELRTPPAELLEICAEVILVKRHGTHMRKRTARPDVVEEFASQAFRAALKQSLRKWCSTIVQLEFTQMAQYADACSPATTILVEHDITVDLQRQLLANSAEGGAGRWELEQQLQKWQRFEREAWRRVDCVVTMSQKDKEIVSGAKVTACLPNGVDTDWFQPCDQSPEHGRLLFIGSFAHLPNILGLEFFLREVWPLLEGEYRLHVIAGSRPEYYLDLYRSQISADLAQPGIEVEGFVADVRDAYQRAELVVAPLIASAGTNIKVLEAMAMGRVVVSTPAGVNGLDVTPGDDVVVTTSATEMAERIQFLSTHREHRVSIEERARRTAVEKYDWRSTGEKQSALYTELEHEQERIRSQL